MSTELFVVRLHPTYRYKPEYEDREWEVKDHGIAAIFTQEEAARDYSNRTIPEGINPFGRLRDRDGRLYISKRVEYIREDDEYVSEGIDEGISIETLAEKIRSFGLQPPQDTKKSRKNHSPPYWPGIYQRWWREQESQTTYEQKHSICQLMQYSPFEIIRVPLINTATPTSTGENTWQRL